MSKKIKEKKKKYKPFPKLSKEQEAEIFKSLARCSYLEAAKENKLHEISPDSDEKRLSTIVFSIARKIKNSPAIWGITQDVVDLVQESLDNRSLKKNPQKAREIALQQEETFKDKLDNLRDKTADLLAKKLKKADTAKGLEEISIRDLKDLLATTIDKGRLLKGESTENIIKLSRIDTDNMSPEEALQVVFKAREALLESKK